MALLHCRNECWTSIWFYLIAFIHHWHRTGCHYCNTVHQYYILMPCSGKGYFVFFVIPYPDASGIKQYLFKKWTYNTDNKTCVILTPSMMNFVGASENITCLISSLLHVPEWGLCWMQVLGETAGRTQWWKQDNSKIITFVSSGLPFRDGSWCPVLPH